MAWLIGIAVALVALGFFVGRWFALPAAAVLVALPIAVAHGFSDVGPIESTPACDPSCGISLIGALILVTPAAAVLAALGVAARRASAWHPSARGG